MTTGQPIPTNHQVFRIDLILSNFSMVNPLGLAPIVFWLGSIAHVLPGNALFNQLFFLAQHHPKSQEKSKYFHHFSTFPRVFPGSKKISRLFRRFLPFLQGKLSVFPGAAEVPKMSSSPTRAERARMPLGAASFRSASHLECSRVSTNSTY